MGSEGVAMLHSLCGRCRVMATLGDVHCVPSGSTLARAACCTVTHCNTPAPPRIDQHHSSRGASCVHTGAPGAARAGRGAPRSHPTCGAPQPHRGAIQLGGLSPGLQQLLPPEGRVQHPWAGAQGARDIGADPPCGTGHATRRAAAQLRQRQGV